MSTIEVGRKYDEEFKIQALKLAKEVGPKQVATELEMSENTSSGWIYKARKVEIDTGAGSRTPEGSLYHILELCKIFI